MSCLDWPRPKIEYAMEEVPDTSRTPSPQFRCGSNFENEIPISWEECNTQQFRKIQTRFFLIIYAYFYAYIYSYIRRTKDTTWDRHFEAQTTSFADSASCFGIVTQSTWTSS